VAAIYGVEASGGGSSTKGHEDFVHEGHEGHEGNADQNFVRLGVLRGQLFLVAFVDWTFYVPSLRPPEKLGHALEEATRL